MVTSRPLLHGQKRSISDSSDRQLLIYTWGCSCRERLTIAVEKNYNAAIISSYPQGINLKTTDGRSIEMQDAFLKARKFTDFVDIVCSDIEANDYHTISINCRKGRHRSASAAEVLKRLHYPNATVIHVEL